MSIAKFKLLIIPLLKKSGVRRSSIFGSFARNENSKKSDLDILVEMPRTATLLDLLELKEKLEKKVKREVDLLTYQSVTPALRKIIEKDQIEIL